LFLFVFNECLTTNVKDFIKIVKFQGGGSFMVFLSLEF
jgi:hypothetical protein